MRTRLGVVSAAAILSLALAGVARAQCTMEIPGKAKSIAVAFVPAYVQCTAPNIATQDGLPACKPPTTEHVLSSSPPGGWLWRDPTSASDKRASGTLQLKAAKNKLTGPLNPPGTADVAVSVKLADVFDENGAATSNGGIYFDLRITSNDPVNGDLTVVDLPLATSLTVAAGKTKKKTTLNVILNTVLGIHGFPACSSVQLRSAVIRDPNGNAFAEMGLYLP